jgi:hypothetical protein
MFPDGLLEEECVSTCGHTADNGATWPEEGRVWAVNNGVDTRSSQQGRWLLRLRHE